MDCPLNVPGLKGLSFSVLYESVHDLGLNPQKYVDWWKTVQEEEQRGLQSIPEGEPPPEDCESDEDDDKEVEPWQLEGDLDQPLAVDPSLTDPSLTWEQVSEEAQKQGLTATDWFTSFLDQRIRSTRENIEQNLAQRNIQQDAELLQNCVQQFEPSAQLTKQLEHIEEELRDAMPDQDAEEFMPDFDPDSGVPDHGPPPGLAPPGEPASSDQAPPVRPDSSDQAPPPAPLPLPELALGSMGDGGEGLKSPRYAPSPAGTPGASSNSDQGEWFAFNTATRKMYVPEKTEMQKLKERGVSHVRNRTVKNIEPTGYAELRDFLLQPHIHEKACILISEAQPLAGKQGKEFCTWAWQTGLRMMQEVRDMSQEERNEHWRPLTSRPCPAILTKYEDFIPNYEDSERYLQLLINLANHHTGELVELQQQCKQMGSNQGALPN